MNKKKLCLVGSGIKTISHITVEVKSHITQADLVIYLVNEPVLKEWIVRNSKISTDLEKIYFSEPKRAHAYKEITKEIIMSFKQYSNVCVVMYGHPTVFASPGLEAIKQARAMGIEANILPGISFLDCLYAELLINPGDCGCYFVEATDLIKNKKNIEVRSHLMICQIGLIGNEGHDLKENNAELQASFLKYLLQFYPAHYDCFLYESSVYSSFDPKIQVTQIKNIFNNKTSKLTTLYIPPVNKPGL